MYTIKQSLRGVVLLLAMFFCIPSLAAAHVTVKPAEVQTATFQTFTVSVPNEKAIPTTSVKLLVPEGLSLVTPTKKAGWTITTDKQGNGQEAKIVSIVWDGGTIEEGLREEFTVSAKTPSEAAELEWKAYQTYSDGTTVAWDMRENGDNHDESQNSGPSSMLKITDQAEPESTTKIDDSDSKKRSDRALFISIGALIIALGSVALNRRKDSK